MERPVTCPFRYQTEFYGFTVDHGGVLRIERDRRTGTFRYNTVPGTTPALYRLFDEALEVLVLVVARVVTVVGGETVCVLLGVVECEQ